jgi:hypothetical protein
MVELLGPAWHRFRRKTPQLWWGLLLALHLPIFAGVLASLMTGEISTGTLLSAGSLLLAIGFFSLKVRDPRFLHFGSTQRSFLAWCLIIAMAHSGALQRSQVDPVVLETTAVVVVQVAVALALLKKRRQLWRGLMGLLTGLSPNSSELSWSGFAEALGQRKPPRLALALSSAPRGPPRA